MQETIEAPSIRDNSPTEDLIHAGQALQVLTLPPPWITYCGLKKFGNKGPGVNGVNCLDCLMVLRSKGIDV